MGSMLDSLLVLVFVLNISALGTSRIVNVIWIVAAQGFVLALLPVLAHSEVTGVGVVVGVSTAGIKGVTIPLLLQRAMREVQIRREVEPLMDRPVRGGADDVSLVRSWWIRWVRVRSWWIR